MFLLVLNALHIVSAGAMTPAQSADLQQKVREEMRKTTSEYDTIKMVQFLAQHTAVSLAFAERVFDACNDSETARKNVYGMRYAMDLDASAIVAFMTMAVVLPEEVWQGYLKIRHKSKNAGTSLFSRLTLSKDRYVEAERKAVIALLLTHYPQCSQYITAQLGSCDTCGLPQTIRDHAATLLLPTMPNSDKVTAGCC